MPTTIKDTPPKSIAYPNGERAGRFVGNAPISESGPIAEAVIAEEEQRFCSARRDSYWIHESWDCSAWRVDEEKVKIYREYLQSIGVRT